MPLPEETASELEAMRMRLLEMLAPLQRAEDPQDLDIQVFRQSLWSAVRGLGTPGPRRGLRLLGFMVELPETLGDRIARLRRSLGWSQAELAGRVGCKLTQVSKYERGAYEPRLATLILLATA